MKRMTNVADWRGQESVTQLPLALSSRSNDSKTTLKPNRGNDNNSREGFNYDGSNIIKDAVDSWKRFQQKQLKSK